MRVTVKLYAVLQVGRFQEKVLSCSVGATVADVIDSLELPTEHVDILLINGVHSDTGALLNENDILSVLPMVEGG